MSPLLVPYAVLLVSAIAAIHLPSGRDLAVPIFLIPFYALTPDIGVNMALCRVLFLVLFVKYALCMKLTPTAVPHAHLLIATAVIGVIAASITMADLDTGIVFAGGELRNGSFRVAVVLFAFTLTFVPFVLILSPRLRVSPTCLVSAYVNAVLVVCIIGILQYAVFRITGTDFIPIGVFNQTNADFIRSGLIMKDGVFDLRPGSLAGEPKGLGMFAASAIVLLLTLGPHFYRYRWVRLAALGICVVTIYLTQSTSALLSVLVGVSVYALVRWTRRPLSRGNVFAAYLVSALALSGVYLSNVSQRPVNTYDAVQTIETPGALARLYHRTFGRMTVEDHDFVVLKAMLAEPSSLILGRGFGLGHLNTHAYIPDVHRHYMEGRILSPKSGVTYFLVNFGLLGMVLMMGFLAAVTPSARDVSRQPDPTRAAMVQSLQLAMMPLVILLLLRIYIWDVTLLIGAIATLSVHTAWSASALPGSVMARPSRASRGWPR